MNLRRKPVRCAKQLLTPLHKPITTSDVPVGPRGVADAGEEGVVGVRSEAGVSDLDTARLGERKKFGVNSVSGHTCEDDHLYQDKHK